MMVTPPRTPPGLQNTGSLVAPDTAAAAISPFSSRQHYFPYTLDFQRGRIIPNLHRGFIFYLYFSLVSAQTEEGRATLNVQKTSDATKTDC